KKVKPVKPNISQEDSLVALSEKASAQPGNSLPPNKNLERFIFCLPKNKPTPTMSKKYNIISIIIIVSKHIPPLKSAYKKDRKSTRLNSSHVSISYAVFCLKKKKKKKYKT